MEAYRIPDNMRVTLAAARVSAQLTQDEVAARMHIAKSTVISWEKGNSAPTVMQAQALCELYGRPMDSIIFGKNRT